MPRGIACLIAAALAGLAATPSASALPPVEHVFVIVLENKDYEESFGPDTKAPYLARQLTAEGQLLENYFGTSHLSLGNYISMVSGLAPNPDTQGDCLTTFGNVFPGVLAPDGQVVGSGCVYPPEAKTIADQLDAAGRSWRGYMEDMGNSPPAPSTCRHPEIGSQDDTQSAREGDQYATRHNPFVYFHSIIDDQARCDAGVVPLAELALDLRRAKTTPSFAFITPDLCSDGHDTPCIDGRPGGLESVDVFLKEWVPRITSSRAYKDGGVVFITWDEANFPSDSDACCDQPTGPNTPRPGITGPGGGRTGSVLLSPFTRRGTTNNARFNHYSLLRSIEDLFGLEYLGYAGLAGQSAFGDDVFDEPAPGSSKLEGCKKARRGKPVGSFRLARHETRAMLELWTARKAKLKLKRGKRRIRARRRLKPCREYRLALPAGHHKVKFVAASGRRKSRGRLSY